MQPASQPVSQPASQSVNQVEEKPVNSIQFSLLVVVLLLVATRKSFSQVRLRNLIWSPVTLLPVFELSE